MADPIDRTIPLGAWIKSSRNLTWHQLATTGIPYTAEELLERIVNAELPEDFPCP